MDRPGRPTLYKPEFADQAHKLCLMHATNQELADCFEDRQLAAQPPSPAAARAHRTEAGRATRLARVGGGFRTDAPR